MSAPSAELTPAERLRLFVRVGIFLALVFAGNFLFPLAIRFLSPDLNGTLVASALSVFATGAVANTVLARGWENGKLSDFGLAWTNQSLRQLGMGVAGGAGAGIMIVLLALILRLASFSSNPAPHANWAAVPLLIVILSLGAIGEELMFHGYAFQQLLPVLGEFAIVLPVGVIFGFAHMGNHGVTPLAIFNTIAWGVLLGYAYLRTKALWLPIGLHFGWNLAQPLLGVNLSGFTMGMTGYELHWRTSLLLSGGDYGLEGGLFTTVIVIALFFLLPRVEWEKV